MMRRLLGVAALALTAPAASSGSSSSSSAGKSTSYALDVPDIFIIGAQKSGTTSLNDLLDRHPGICNEGVKEKHFFSDATAFKHSLRTHVEAYLAEFEGCTNASQLTLDATPSYIWLEHSPQLVQQMYRPKDLAKKRFILLLREPTARRYSEYQRELRLCLSHYDSTVGYPITPEHAAKYCSRVQRSAPTLDSRGAASAVALRSFAAWDAAEAGQKELSRGYYLEQIQRWLAVIDRSQLLVLNFVDLVGHTTDTVTRLCTFLGIDPSPLYTANDGDEGSEDRRARRRSTKTVGTAGKGKDEAVVATAPVPEIVLPAPPSWNKYFTMEVPYRPCPCPCSCPCPRPSPSSLDTSKPSACAMEGVGSALPAS